MTLLPVLVHAQELLPGGQADVVVCDMNCHPLQACKVEPY